MPLSTLPVISLESPALPGEIGASLRQYGFAMVSDFGIDPGLVARAWSLTVELFALPQPQKLAWHDPANAGARGYTPFGREIAVAASAPDLKEFWHIGRDLPAGHPLISPSMPANIWPDRPEPFAGAFRETFTALYAAFEAAAARVLSAIAGHLGLPPAHFDPQIAGGNSVLRLLHYPPQAHAPADALRAAPHGDINLITLLLGAEESGLELLGRDGGWIPVTPPPGALVVNVGDMLARLTGDALPSTIHRVRNPAGPRAHLPRYSMPFFLHLRGDVPLEPLPGCAPSAATASDTGIVTADAFLQQRLAQIGLKG
jgi:isopenicillin N synthase-like dioxygenase